MKVTHITDIDKFFEVIDSCKGRVELVTGEGDRLNLKSKLSQMSHIIPHFSVLHPWAHDGSSGIPAPEPV